MKTKLIIAAIGIILLTTIDLATKEIAADTLKGQPSITVIEGFWNFDYVENQNSAFSLGRQIPSVVKQYLITGFGFLALLFLGYFFYKSPKTNVTLISVSLIFSGACGNLIDRIMNGYVVDFIHWYYGSFNWPVFNMADVYVTCGMFLLIYEFIFSEHYKEERKNEETDVDVEPT